MKLKSQATKAGANKVLLGMLAFFILLPVCYIPLGMDAGLMPRVFLINGFTLLALVYISRNPNSNQVYISDGLPVLFLPVVALLSIFVASNRVESLPVIIKFTTVGISVTTLLVLLRHQRITLLQLTGAIAWSGMIATMIAILALLSFWMSKGFSLNHDQMYAVSATFGHKNLLSSYLLFTLPFQAVHLRSQQQQTLRVVFLVLCLAVIGVLQTRAVWLALLLSGFVWTWLHLYHLRYWKWVFPLLAVLGILGIVLWVANAQLPPSFAERAAVWKNTVSMINEYPILGVGAGNWQIYFPKYGLAAFYEINYTITEGLHTFQRPHNDWLWILAEYGIPAGSIYICVWICGLVFGIRQIVKGSTHMIPVVTASVAFILVSAVDFPLERMEHTFIGWLLLGVLWANQKWIPLKHISGISKWVFPIILVLMSYAFFRFQAELKLRKLYQSHLTQQWERMVQIAADIPRSLVSLDLTSIPISWYEGLAQKVLKHDEAALACFESAYMQHPYQLHVLHNLGVCLEEAGRTQEAIQYLETLNRISPTFSDGLIALAASYYNAGRLTDAYQTISAFTYDAQNPKYLNTLTAILRGVLREMAEKEQAPGFKLFLKQLELDPQTTLTYYQAATQRKQSFESFVSTFKLLSTK